MKPVVLFLALSTAGLAHAQRAHLAPVEREVRQRLLEDARPSFAGAVVLLTAGGIVGTAGTAASVFGVLMMAMSGNSLFSELTLAIGAVFAIPGAGALVLGIAMMVAGSNRLRDHLTATDEIDDLRNQRWPAAAVWPVPMPMIAVLEF